MQALSPHPQAGSEASSAVGDTASPECEFWCVNESLRDSSTPSSSHIHCPVAVPQAHEYTLVLIQWLNCGDG
ncbi:MAG: hypothetical protein J07HQX50_01559 [Haloquadratum sp. J07HQX50]|nr:MAG: hypothetical protein J07HQX50_01559 [Haloquadratum sp. J07HQX50]